jgi:hypothetical protein
VKKAFVGAVTASVLSGCATYSPEMWTSSSSAPVPRETLLRDEHECAQEGVKRESASLWYWPLPQLAGSDSQAMYEKCMTAKGWRRKGDK